MPGRFVVDLNADIGEGVGHPHDDLRLLRFVTSVNVACGGHAGDGQTMRLICSAATDADVAVGAHPGYPDRQRFGRHETGASAGEIEDLVAGQLTVLVEAAEATGTRVGHVKPHGALYHRCWFDPEAASAAVAAILATGPEMAVFAPPGSELERAALAAGLDSIAEGFVDRAYGADGALVPRSQPGAVLAPDAAAAQAVELAGAGGAFEAPVRSLCLHGDGEEPLAVARAVSRALAAAGVEVRRYR